MWADKRVKFILAGFILTLAVFILASSVAFAEEITCSGTMGAVTVDNLRVPPDATCNLDRTLVEGNIKVETNATLYATNVNVIGNVQAENAAQVEVLPGSVVGGSIQIVQSGGARIDSVRIDSDLFFDTNNGYITATENQIGGNLQAFQNTGSLSITNNVIDGNLQCKENDPRPTGGGNLVQGNKEDQCADLQQPTFYQFMPLVVLR